MIKLGNKLRLLGGLVLTAFVPLLGASTDVHDHLEADVVNTFENSASSGSTLALDHGNHSGYTSVTSTSQLTSGLLTAGSYVLEGDFSITSEIEISGNVTFCLNGHDLSGSNSTRIFNVYYNASLNLCDCQETGAVTNGYYDGTVQGGGAIYLSSLASLTLEGVTISNSRATQTNGGAIYLSSRNTLTINEGTTITGNTAAGYGGGIYDNLGSSITINGGTISNNLANSAGNGYGGGIAISSSSGYEYELTINGGTITNNASTAYSESTAYDGGGGGINIGSNSTGTFTMNGGTISNNVVSYYNFAYAASTYGAGVNIESGTFTFNGGSITSNLLLGNYASIYGTYTAHGAGVRVYGSSTASNPTRFVMNGGRITYNRIFNDTYSSYTSDRNAIALTNNAQLTISGGYVEGTQISSSLTDATSAISIEAGYFDSTAYSNYSSYISNNSTYIYLANSDYGTSFDSNYESGFEYAVYHQGGTPTYTLASELPTICVNTDYEDYIDIAGRPTGTATTYRYVNDSTGDSGNGLPTAAGSYTITATVRDYVVSSTMTYYPSASLTMQLTINEHSLVDGRYNYDDGYHWGACVNEVCDDTSTAYGAHTYTLAKYNGTAEGHYSLCDVCEAEGELGEHTWSDWVVVEEPTSDSTGLEERTCTVCSYVESNVLEQSDSTLLITLLIIGGIILLALILIVIYVLVRRNRVAAAGVGGLPAVSSGKKKSLPSESKKKKDKEHELPSESKDKYRY